MSHSRGWSDENKSALIRLLKPGNSYKTIGLALNKTPGACRQFFCRYLKTAGLPPKEKMKKSAFSASESLFIKKTLTDFPSFSANNIRTSFLNRYNWAPSLSTFHRYIRQIGYQRKIATNKIVISSVNKVKRVQFATFYRNNIDFLKRKVFYSDESTVKATPNGTRLMIYVQKTAKKENSQTQNRIQGGKFSVMFAGSMSWYGFGPLVVISGSIDSEKYISSLSDVILPELEYCRDHMEPEMTFMQDGASAHRSSATTEFLRSQGVSPLPWPPQSPDMNPIELAWNILKQKLQSEYTVPASRDQLIENVFQIWDSFDVSLARRLIGRLDYVIPEVIRKKAMLLFKNKKINFITLVTFT